MNKVALVSGVEDAMRSVLCRAISLQEIASLTFVTLEKYHINHTMLENMSNHFLLLYFSILSMTSKRESVPLKLLHPFIFHA